MRFAKPVLDKMEQYNEKVQNKNVQIAAALDPRVKQLISKFGIDISLISTEIENEFNVYYKHRYNSIQTVIENKEATDTNSSIMNSLLEFIDADNFSTCAASEEPFSSELQRWFNHQPMNLNQSSRDVCQWFQVNKNLYPSIEIKAKDYIGISASSVPSECAFSAAGCVVSKKRTRFSDESVQAICEL